MKYGTKKIQRRATKIVNHMACPTFPTSLIFLNNVMYQQIVLRFQGILFSGATGFRQEMKTVLALLLF